VKSQIHHVRVTVAAATPQMISCRVQFGVYGAIIPIVAVCLMYIGFSASGCVLAGQAVGVFSVREKR
jgi:purine-cytosine permease-like protein